MWTFGFVTAGDSTAFEAAAVAANDAYHTEQDALGALPTDETDDQIDAAIVAAEAIATSGACGDAGELYNVVLEGHANPGHTPVANQPPDYIVIRIAYTT